MQNLDLQSLADQAKKQGRPFKILIVDDEQWIREVFHDFCSVTDAFEIDTASDGAEAITKTTSNRYDLITLDLIMPEMSGLDALSEIKRTAPQVPIMIITGNATEKLVKTAGVMGACRVLYKPVTLEAFITELSSALIR